MPNRKRFATFEKLMLDPGTGPNHYTNNVVNLFEGDAILLREPIDPMEIDSLMEMCRDFFSRGQSHLETTINSDVKENLGLTQKDMVEYGMKAPILMVRSHCEYDAHKDVCIEFLMDARLPRFCQFIFAAHINGRDLPRVFCAKMLGKIGDQIGEVLHRSNDEAIDILIRGSLVEDLDGQLRPTRKLCYFILETLIFLADRMQNWGTKAQPAIRQAIRQAIGSEDAHNWVSFSTPLQPFERDFTLQ